ncbi:hypothetical protein [Gloeocapsa sp. PCC 73106]|uniref:hypothetical protein n=1 Tax=Gloeocapsa sp. PCC 73106 TaxID=102232 RepID=UPI0002AB9C76|nr:hypothetical protein [Gloeocapsa sp. PCC 73106]ELR96464.1 hypothetical protein GLO73106DRAFT_00002580 [Gloeocapsa sp. PCC 73106]
MEQQTKDAFLLAYENLQRIAYRLYEQAQNAIDADLFLDANLLISQADKIFELAENLEIVISEQEE